MPTLNEILNGETVYVLEFTSNNTLTYAYTFENHNAGATIQNAGAAIGVNYVTNSRIKASNGTVMGLSTSKMLETGVSITRNLSAPYSDDAASSISYSTLTLKNQRSSDNLKKRKYKGRRAKLSAGGLIHKGKANEQRLTWDQYEVVIDGRFTGVSKDFNQIRLDLGARSFELDKPFPTAVYSSGFSKGATIPWVEGYVVGRFAMRQDIGLWHYHGGTIDVSDPVLDYLPVFLWSAEKKLINPKSSPTSAVKMLDYHYSVGSTRIDLLAKTNVTYTGSDFTWAQVDSKTLTATLSSLLDVTVTAKDDSITLEPTSNYAFNVIPSTEETQRYRALDFNWVQDSDKKVRSTGIAAFEAEIDGDQNISYAGSRLFKIDGSGSSTITIKAPKNMRSGNLIIQAVRPPAQTIGNFSFDSFKVSPPFQDTTEPLRHTMVISHINSDTITFDYTSSQSGLNMAVWFDDVTLYDSKTVPIEISFSGNINGLKISHDSLNQGASLYGTDGPITDAVIVGDETLYTIDDQLTTQFDLNVTTGHGPSSIRLYDCLYDQDQDFQNYGVFVEEQSIRMVPPPPNLLSDGSIISSCSLLFRILPHGYQYHKTTLKIRARLVSEDILTAVLLVGGSPGLGRPVITQDWKEFTFDELNLDGITSPASETGLLTLFRGTTPTPEWDNPNETFEIQIENALMFVQETDARGNLLTTSTVQTRNINSDEVKELATYRVDNARTFQNLPDEGFSVYDINSYIRTSDNYDNLVFDGPGQNVDIDSMEIFRAISQRATGVDHITSGIVGKPSGVMLTEQRPWIKHVSQLASMCDYYYRENEAVHGITMFERYDGVSGVNDFIFQDRDIAKYSHREDGFDDRQYRYIIEYQPNYGDPTKTKKITSSIGYSGRSDTKTIESIFLNEEDNQELANRIFRDSSDNVLESVELNRIEYDLQEGHAGNFIDDDIPLMKPCEVHNMTFSDIGNNEVKTTSISYKVYL